ncbi:hypothetical protein PTTW11_03146 [Pyrenophora teres f. teres]|uniref:Uncharacterized protein n=1 Tax=Pyrenophora teres f. teres TaxID=97479 RepID=A0A6S6VWN3_9PLEO|nr:hypothetical protein PTTW11_03146 [Pyrenophora teres f. teres]
MLFRLLIAPIFIGFALAQNVCDCCHGNEYNGGSFAGHWHTQGRRRVGYCRQSIGGGEDPLGCSNLCT